MSSTERRAAGLTPKRLDLLSLTMLAIPDEGVDVCLGDAEVQTLLIGTGEAFGLHASGGLPAGFSPQAKDAQVQALALQPMRQRR